jgi:hypothetical protein
MKLITVMCSLISLGLLWLLVREKMILLRLRENGVKINGEDLRFYNNNGNYFVSYTYSAGYRKHSRIQRIRKRQFVSLMNNPEKVDVTYNSNEPSISRLLEFSDGLKERDLIFFIILIELFMIFVLFLSS